MKKTVKRGRGRPRTRPPDCHGVRVPLSQKERERVNKAADLAGVSAAQWMRNTLILAAGRPLAPLR